MAFDGVGSMPMARIREVRSVKQAVVDVELARRGRSRSLREAVRDSERHAPFAAEGATLNKTLKCAASRALKQSRLIVRGPLWAGLARCGIVLAPARGLKHSHCQRLIS